MARNNMPDTPELAAMEVASRLAEGKSMKEIAKSFGTSVSKIRNIRESDACQEILAEVMTFGKQQAKLRYGSKFQDFMTDAMAALAHNLQEKQDMQAVKLVFKTAGLLEDQDEAAQGDTNITIALPDGTNIKTSLEG